MQRVIPIRSATPEPLEDAYVRLFQSEEKIQARSVQGRYARLRWLTVWVTQLVFYGLPWLSWGQRQAVLFDLEARRFYIFGLVLYPQDFIYLAALLIICALALFLVTAVAGRVWCGFGCPQTVYTELFMWIERKVEGDRQQRIRLDAAPWSADKLMRKSLKHGLWAMLALWTGYTFVAYFVPIHILSQEVFSWRLGPWETFWIFFYSFATYGNAGFLREQVCKYMCPYARFQSAMFDKDTLIITYDEARGEPRGSRGRKVDPKAQGLGDCIDCTLCVQVCPTGIDIRNGLQYECIACAACVDACNTVMKKMDYAPGLIRYSTQRSMELLDKVQVILQRLRRPRILIYLSTFTLIVAAWLASLSQRHPFKMDVVRDRGALARIVSGGKLENVYRVQLMNASDLPQHFSLQAQGLPGLELTSEAKINVPASQSQWVVVRLAIPYGQASAGSHAINLLVKSDLDERVVQEKTVFYVPR
jgi:cytochrome c oxidase accessory protein FixG